MKKFTERKVEKYYGVDIGTEEEPIGSKSDLKDINSALKLLESENILMPANFFLNLNIESILNKKGYHSFIYRFIRADDKIRIFFVDYILDKIDKFGELKYPIVIVINEIDLLTPFKATGFNSVFAHHLKVKMEKMRKKGVTFFVVSHRYTSTDERVRGACAEKWFHKLEDDDLDRLKKVRSYNKKIIDTIEKLGVGEFVVEGFENKVIMANVPKHGHKHTYMHFEEEYRKHYPDKMVDYSDLIQKVEDKVKELKDRFEVGLKKGKEQRMVQIKREVQQKLKAQNKESELKEMKEKEKDRKVVDKVKRDEMIVQIYKQWVSEGKKISYRKIAQELENKNISCSYVTVKTVLDIFNSNRESNPIDLNK